MGTHTTIYHGNFPRQGHVRLPGLVSTQMTKKATLISVENLRESVEQAMLVNARRCSRCTMEQAGNLLSPVCRGCEHFLQSKMYAHEFIKIEQCVECAFLSQMSAIVYARSQTKSFVRVHNPHRQHERLRQLVFHPRYRYTCVLVFCLS